MSSSGSCFGIGGQANQLFLFNTSAPTCERHPGNIIANAMVWLNIEFSLAHPDKCHCNRFISKAQNFKLSLGNKDSSKENYQEGQERVGRRENEGRPPPVTMHCVHDGHSCTRAAEHFTLKLLITPWKSAGWLLRWWVYVCMTMQWLQKGERNIANKVEAMNNFSQPPLPSSGVSLLYKFCLHNWSSHAFYEGPYLLQSNDGTLVRHCIMKTMLICILSRTRADIGSTKHKLYAGSFIET